MKKKVAMLLLAMSLVMTACGGNAKMDEDKDTRVENREEESEEESTEESSEESMEVSAEESTEDIFDEQDTIPYAFGTYTDTGYENASMGYRFTAPEGCTVADENQLLSIAGLTMDSLSEDYTEAMMEYARQAMVYDLYAVYADTNTNVNIIVQQTDTTGVTMDYFIEANRAQLEALTAMDITVEPGTIDLTIAGKEYTGLKTVTVSNGISMTQELYLLIEEGRVSTVTFTCIEGNEAQMEALKAAFTAL
ncbi:MAG: hypothetical protein E7287_03950 [Lachnospiraceae bacterium]|nr:hypothetical protein [Lachnospiraceae bacterium]